MHYLYDTESIYLDKCRKNVYLGHRRFLLTNHQCRKKGKHFKGEVDHRKKPTMRIGDHVLAMVNDLHVIFGKGPNDAEGHAPMWKKKSIFWDLPYWKDLEARSSIDVMHVTKNLCVNLLGFLGVYGKTKDTPEAWRTCNVCTKKTACLRSSIKVLPATLLQKKRKKSSLNACSVWRSRLASRRI